MAARLLGDSFGSRIAYGDRAAAALEAPSLTRAKPPAPMKSALIWSIGGDRLGTGAEKRLMALVGFDLLEKLIGFRQKLSGQCPKRFRRFNIMVAGKVGALPGFFAQEQN